MPTRGVRGATTVPENEPEAIWQATQELLAEIVESNDIDAADIAAAYFTVTPDLVSAFPARAARLIGWDHVPLLDALEIPVPGSLDHCLRVMLLWNTTKTQQEIVHVYQRGARALRPDLVQPHSPKEADRS